MDEWQRMIVAQRVQHRSEVRAAAETHPPLYVPGIVNATQAGRQRPATPREQRGCVGQMTRNHRSSVPLQCCRLGTIKWRRCGDDENLESSEGA